MKKYLFVYLIVWLFLVTSARAGEIRVCPNGCCFHDGKVTIGPCPDPQLRTLQDWFDAHPDKVITPVDNQPAGPTQTFFFPYSLVPQQYSTFHVEHHLGYIPIVQVVTGDSLVDYRVFRVTETEVWFHLQNTIISPGMVLEGTVRVDLW